MYAKATFWTLAFVLSLLATGFSPAKSTPMIPSVQSLHSNTD
jgi:hypothetical protein